MSGSEDDRDDYGAPDDRLMHGKTRLHLLVSFFTANVNAPGPAAAFISIIVSLAAMLIPASLTSASGNVGKLGSSPLQALNTTS